MNNQTFRNSDPITSRQPVKNKLTLQKIALDAIAKNPNSTAGDLEITTQRSGIWKRLGELERKGLIHRTGVALFSGTGKWQTTWKIREQQLGLEEML